MKFLPDLARNLLSACCAALILVGCAMPERIVPNQTSADELLRQLGQPTTKRPGPAGGEVWDYVYGPDGVQTWRFTVDAQRRVSSVTPLLTEERLRRLVPGQSTEQDVLEMLGKPRDTGRVGGEMTWEWRVDLQPQLGVYVVRFDNNGRVSGYNILPDVLYDGGNPGP
jgi:outer membrane protein assembly factor BamE (lipoprotein component of BamABCDE complex)